MNKSNAISAITPILIFVFALAPVLAQIEIEPSEHDFGEVEVGTYASTMISMMNMGWEPYHIENIEFVAGSSMDFSLIEPIEMPFVLANGESRDVEVVFSPSAEGYKSAEVSISWTNGMPGTSFVYLGGAGVAIGPPPSTIQDIINFFDESVADGTLVGAGSGKSAEHRLQALRKMLVNVDRLISQGNYMGACGQLQAAFKRCGSFAQGAAQDELKGMIQDLMEDLGCR